MPNPAFLATLACLACLPASPAQAPAAAGRPPDLRQFTSRSRTFHIDLPAAFRQLAPGEARQLAANPATPAELRYVEPAAFYVVGDVDRWLAGDLSGPWLQVVEQGNEWHVEGDFAAQLAAQWQQQGAANGMQHALADIREDRVGPHGHPIRRADRTTQRAGARATRSLDIHAPAGGRQITLSFSSWAEDFPAHAPEFERWLQTLAFAQPPRGEQRWSDRLWTPLLTGGLVGLVLLVLYKHTRAKR